MLNTSSQESDDEAAIPGTSGVAALSLDDDEAVGGGPVQANKEEDVDDENPAQAFLRAVSDVRLAMMQEQPGDFLTPQEDHWTEPLNRLEIRQWEKMATFPGFEHLTAKLEAIIKHATDLDPEFFHRFRFAQMRRCNLRDKDRKVEVLPHQLMFLFMALQATNVYGVVGLFDTMGTGKTFMMLLYIHTIHLISKLRDHHGAHCHGRDEHGRCDQSPETSKWWPFRWCVCEDECPGFLKRDGHSLTGYNLMMSPPAGLTSFLRDYESFFESRARQEHRDYLLEFICAFDTKTLGADPSERHWLTYQIDHRSQAANLALLAWDTSGPRPLRSRNLSHLVVLTTPDCARSWFKAHVLDRKDGGGLWFPSQRTTDINAILVDECHKINGEDTAHWKFTIKLLEKATGDCNFMPASGTVAPKGLRSIQAILKGFHIKFKIKQSYFENAVQKDAADGMPADPTKLDAVQSLKDILHGTRCELAADQDKLIRMQLSYRKKHPDEPSCPKIHNDLMI